MMNIDFTMEFKPGKSKYRGSYRTIERQLPDRFQRSHERRRNSTATPFLSIASVSLSMTAHL